MKYRVILLAIGMMLCMASCGKASEEQPAAVSTQAEEAENQSVEEKDEKNDHPEEKKDDSEPESAQEAETEPEESSEENFSFEQFKNMDFLFASGAGGWGTIMHIQPDGSFEGEYHDSEMGITGDDYPNGTVYLSNFSGQFTKPVKVNEYTYSMQVEEIHYEKEPGMQEISDGVCFIYAEAYGIAGAENILIYTPGTPLDALSEEFRSWIGYYDLSATEDKELPFYALNNEVEEQGFVGHDIVEDMKDQIQWTDEYAASLEQSIENDSLGQEQLVEKSQQLYETWDDILNTEWKVLKRILNADRMGTLTDEQRAWIAKKEQSMEAAKAQSEDSVEQTVAANVCGAKMTKERVYELLEYLE